MNARLVTFLLAAAFAAGCETNGIGVDRTPPFPPKGISTETGDGVIRISWFENSEPDVAGYNIYVSNAYNGTYQVIGQTSGLSFLDTDAGNGITVYYAVTAVDGAGNESDLSTDVAYDTPRPEGFGVNLPNFHTNPSTAGYDFSTYTVGPYDDEFTDLVYEYLDGTSYFDVWSDTEIQDMGYTESLADIGAAPTAGWAPTHDVRLVLGHTYVVKTWDNHYAKVRVRGLSSGQVTFDWAYQLQAGNTRLKAPADRGPLTPGEGFASRNR